MIQLSDVRETILVQIGWTHHRINFYLKALDQDVKKEHENPSIGILLYQDQDTEVVKYALNRSMSPTQVAAYQTQLPDKNILQQKWKEVFEETTILKQS